MIKKIKEKTLKIGVIAFAIALIGVLTFSSISTLAESPTPTSTPLASPTPAASPAATPTRTPAPTLQIIQGKVTAIADDRSSVIIQSITIKLNTSTQYKQYQETPALRFGTGRFGWRWIPFRGGFGFLGGRFNRGAFDSIWNKAQSATVSDIAVGDTIIAKVNSDHVAQQVLIIKVVTLKRVQGTITAMDNNSITITQTNGTAVKLTWDKNTRFVIVGATSFQTGETVTATYDGTCFILLGRFLVQPGEKLFNVLVRSYTKACSQKFETGTL